MSPLPDTAAVMHPVRIEVIHSFHLGQLPYSRCMSIHSLPRDTLVPQVILLRTIGKNSFSYPSSQRLLQRSDWARACVVVTSTPHHVVRILQVFGFVSGSAFSPQGLAAAGKG